MVASTPDDISSERMGLNSRKCIEQNNEVEGGGIVLSDQDTPAKVEYPSSSISKIPVFCQTQTSLQTVCCKNLESRKNPSAGLNELDM